ncbi:putative Sterol regulatory element-binding protein cleavage-activating protein [Cucumis melo var. makuwa]|uniref:Putative Sterol regulatory element-binding protein cleavage-activating protein n=1 Tax=Cucumis melo var. makuwa TaxID=1194695 RepID=A0A5D3DHC5_CUCMM|nr:putative Sterol regulatory element-binding protein cleavage-activating protein [Cucumis melo var. makuwa]
MKSFGCSFRQALLLPKPPPRNQRTVIINDSTITKNRSNFTTTSRGQVQVNAKGFTGSPATAKNRETAAKNLSGQNNNEDDDDEIPEAVYSRIITRILAFVGIPMAFGVTLLKIFQAIKEQNLWDVPIWVPFFTTFLTFGASTMGIAYGTLSTSLDPEKKGSVVGWEEAQKNWVEMWKEEDEVSR